MCTRVDRCGVTEVRSYVERKRELSETIEAVIFASSTKNLSISRESRSVKGAGELPVFAPRQGLVTPLATNSNECLCGLETSSVM